MIVHNISNNQITTGIFLIKGHTLYQCNELGSFKEMDKDVENSDVSCGHFLMNTQNISKANNMSSIYSTKKRDVNVTSVSEMEDISLHDGVLILILCYLRPHFINIIILNTIMNHIPS